MDVDTHVMEALVFVVIVLVVIAVAGVSFWLKQKRRQGFALMARQLGMSFSTADPIGVLGMPFRLFRKGDGRGAENFVHGTWQGCHVALFDFWYYERSSDSNGRSSKTYYRFQCVVTEIAAACSPVTIGPESVLSRIADGLGFDDLQFESEEFNRRFQVQSGDRKFAYDLVDARMMDWLLGTGGAYSFEASGKWLLTSCRKLKPVEIVPLLGRAKGFTDQIPRVVYSLYGLGASG
ncbi:MAG: hypothetical protein WEA10_05290 [Actinomycetota bacterium]